MGKKINITVNGPIGAGKTTLIENIINRLKDNYDVIAQPEPSVTIPFVNSVLKKFYEDNKKWSYPLQLCISAAQEAYMQELRELDYDFALFDASFSSDIYSYSHAKHNRMNIEDFHALVAIGRPFKFDIVIWIDEPKEVLIEHIKNRNKIVDNGENPEDKKDLAIEDFEYIHDHYADFQEYLPIYLNKFKAFNPDVKIFKIKDIPDINSPEYSLFIDSLLDEILKDLKY